jgi:hypothetical protein
MQSGVDLGWAPRLRQPNKTLFADRCKLLDRQDPSAVRKEVLGHSTLEMTDQCVVW